MKNRVWLLQSAFIASTSLGVLAQTAGFSPSNFGQNSVLYVGAMDTYYDGSDGSLFAVVPLPAGATKLQFRVTGGVATDGTRNLASPDGVYADNRAPYNFTATRWAGAYRGTPIGATTGGDPALFGVFFTPDYSGTPLSSLNFRSDSGITPDPRTLTTYSPSVNQPFYIGDGYNLNNALVTTSDNYYPPGTNQTFIIPAGAKYLLLGMGADNGMFDNSNPSSTGVAFVVHVFDDVGAGYAANAPVIRTNYLALEKGADGGLSFNAKPSNLNRSFVTLASENTAVPHATNPPPTSIYTAVEIDWDSQTNQLYQLQYTTSLESNAWQNWGDPIPGNGSTNAVFDSTRGQPKKFYRVLTLK